MAKKNGYIKPAGRTAKFRDWTNLYDSLPLVDGVQPKTTAFFQVQRGQTNGSYLKTESDTNLTASGQITAGNSFEIHYIQFKILGADDLAGYDPSINQILNARSNVKLKINSVERYQAPFQKIPMGFAVNMQSFAQGAPAVAQWPASNAWNSAPNGLRFEFAHIIRQNEAFNVEWTLDDTVTLAGMKANSRIQCILTGLQNKPT